MRNFLYPHEQPNRVIIDGVDISVVPEYQKSKEHKGILQLLVCDRVHALCRAILNVADDDTITIAESAYEGASSRVLEIVKAALPVLRHSNHTMESIERENAEEGA